MNIKTLRCAKGLTQQKLAAQLHISRTAVANWETGYTRPATAMLPMLADALGCPIDALFQERTSAHPSGRGPGQKGGETMTLSDIKAMTKDTITPAEAAPVLGCCPHYLRLTAREAPELLPFPVFVSGCRVRIPREGFIRFMEGA